MATGKCGVCGRTMGINAHGSGRAPVPAPVERLTCRPLR